jgi:purine-binding chemotaxis protein CheW
MSHADALHAYVDSLLGDAAPAAPVPAVPAPVAPAPAARSAVPVRAVPPVPAPAPAPVQPPAALRPEIARLFVPPPVTHDGPVKESTRWLCFLLAGQLYAVEVKKVQEVVRVPDVAPVVGADSDTLGVMNLRGQIVQVISLGRRLALAPASDSHECRIVVLEDEGRILGLLVDAVAEVFAADADAVHESGLVPGSLPADWFRGLLRRGSDLVVALDASRLLDD